MRRLENFEYMTIYSNIRVLFQECNHIVYASFDILEAMSGMEEGSPFPKFGTRETRRNGHHFASAVLAAGRELPHPKRRGAGIPLRMNFVSLKVSLLQVLYLHHDFQMVFSDHKLL